MNIYTAAHYLKVGYKIKRTSWKKGEYIYDSFGNILINKLIKYRVYDHITDTIVVDFSFYEETFDISLSDMLTDDWEIFKENIDE